MFRKQPEQLEGVILVDLAAIEAYQRASDPKTEAPEFIEGTRRELLLAETHPWHASNTKQIQLVMAHIALFNDRTAELLVEEGTVKSKNGPRVPVDIAAFALGLSEIAINQFDQGKKVKPVPGEADVVFSDEWRAVLAPEAQLPFWPAYAKDDYLPEWQMTVVDGYPQRLLWDGEPVDGLSTNFLRGIVRAARWIHTLVDHDLRELSKPNALTEMPREYIDEGLDVPAYIRGRIDEADIDLTTAEHLISTATLELPDHIKHAAYPKAHDAFVNMVQTAVLSVSPQLLGDDFAPKR